MGRIITSVLLALLLPLLVKWMMRTARAEAPETFEPSGDLVMGPSRGYRWIAYGGVSMEIIAIVAFVYTSLPFWRLTLGLGAMFILPLSVVCLSPLYDLRRRVHVARDGVYSFSPWTGRKSAAWSEIESVRFRDWGQTIRIQLRSGGEIVIPSSTLTGVEALESRMRKHLPPSVFEKAFEQYRAYMSR